MHSSLRRTGLELFLASFTALLLELALIRWLPERVRVIAYFPNLVLIASFLGLGVGALAKSRRPQWFGPLMLLVVGCALELGRIAFTARGTSEHLWLLYYDLPKSSPVVDGIYIPITLVFVLTALLFIPLGGMIAFRIQAFKQVGRPLDGYVLDLLGSLAGVVGFLSLAALGSRPVWWFGCAVIAVMWVIPQHGRSRVVFAVPSFLALLLLGFSERGGEYSPYYTIDTVEKARGEYLVLANGSFHQYALDLRASAQAQASPTTNAVFQGYRVPIDNLQQPPRRALVLGAGCGNDVTVLLDAGVPEIHAVEIDPVIIEIGKSKHPARPYLDPRVVVHNTDARAFLENTTLDFDLIVFGTLDSMTRLSALSNVRLDNFVYTLESLKAARRRLSARGGMALMFMVGSDDIGDHLAQLFWHTFDEPPRVYSKHHLVFNKIYFAGPGYDHLKTNPAFRDDAAIAAGRRSVVPTDDWPYLYLARPMISPFYLGVGAMVVSVACVLLFGTSAPLRRALTHGRVDWEMMLLGAAFLLCETGFVTQMNLLFGATWRTSAIIFASILVALISATLIGRRTKIRTPLALLGTVVAIVVVAYLPFREIAPDNLVPKVFFALLVCGVPLTLSGLVFAARFQTRELADVAFGWNVLGAVFGGILEMTSMLLGLHTMFLGAALLYALVLFFVQRQTTSLVSGTSQLQVQEPPS